MADLGIVKSNVAKMVSMNAPESDIDSYIQAEGTTVDAVKNYQVNNSDSLTRLEDSGGWGLITKPIETLTGKTMEQRAKENVNDPNFMQSKTAPFDKFIPRAGEAANNRIVGGQIIDGATNMLNYAPLPGSEFIGEIPIAGTTIGRIASITPVGKGFVEGAKELGRYDQTLKAITPLSSRGIEPIVLPNQAKQAVQTLFSQAVRPSTINKNSAGQIKAYNEKASSAIASIAENRHNFQFPDGEGNLIGRSPRNLDELSKAIDQTKKDFFSEYNGLQQQTGQAGVTVDTSKIIKGLDSVINNRIVKLKDPNAINYATDLKQRFMDAGSISPAEAQELIGSYNADLKAFYQNPAAQDVGRSAINDGVVKSLRDSLDGAIESHTGGDYQGLKTKYGQLTAIEKDVAKRLQVEARKNIKGLPDYSDIFSAGDIAHGILTADITKVGKGLAQHGIKQYFKYINSPDTSIKKMFKIAEKYIPSKKSSQSLGNL